MVSFYIYRKIPCKSKIFYKNNPKKYKAQKKLVFGKLTKFDTITLIFKNCFLFISNFTTF